MAGKGWLLYTLAFWLWRQADISVNPAPRTFIRGLHNLRPEHRGCVTSIGSFDGVHLGHRAILRQLTRAARAHRLPAVVIIFEPQPHEYFARERAPARLMRLREKVRALSDAGVDRILCLRFNESLRSLSAREFIDRVLLQGLAIRHLVVGDDFRFGRDRRGDFNLLREVGQVEGFTVADTCTLEVDGARVSSTRIRQALEAADFEQAERLLGRPYRITGRVSYGRQLGRTLGVPTANLHLRRYRSPLQGVFAIKAYRRYGSVHRGVANVGVRPTVSGSPRPILEVHLLDFDGSLYGELIEVEFLCKLREEYKFESVDKLREQLRVDIEQARRFFNKTD